MSGRWALASRSVARIRIGSKVRVVRGLEIRPSLYFSFNK
jgi:hypothetical protein